MIRGWRYIADAVLLSAFSLIILVGCGKNEGNESSVFSRTVQKGHLIGKVKGKLRYELIMVSPNYLALREHASFPQTSLDSLKASYQNGIQFNFLLKPKDGVNGDLVYTGVKDLSDYKQRIDDLHFNNKELFSLKVGDKRYSPSLCQFNDTYEIERGIQFTVVFEKHDKLDVPIQFLFEDALFGTGITSFFFDQSVINNTLK